MKDHFRKAWDVLPRPLKDFAHTMLVGAGIGALTAGTAKIFQKLNVPHPTEPPKPNHPKQVPRYQPRHEYQQPRRDWSQDHRNRQSNYHRGDGHGR